MEGIQGNGMFPEMRPGMLGLEMPLHPSQNPQNPHNPHHHLHPQQPQMMSYAHHEADHIHSLQQSQQALKHGQYPYAVAAAAKPKQINLGDEDEPGFGSDDSDNKRKMSPWQRMKWTDTMVRLLIMAVYYIGDEGGLSEGGGADVSGKKKSGVVVGGGLLQKKGKWKSVSQAMMEKGFYVSPQQCEDKFNDLNKRYKRVNDILGKGTACKVVENQALLEKMELSSKMKEEVKKLLNSKHLFFREMCAYHNSCGHATAGGTGASAAALNSSPEIATGAPSHVPLQQQPLQQQGCFHVSENALVVANSGRSETEGSKMLKAESVDEDEDMDYEDDESDVSEDEDEGVVEGGSRGQIGHDEDGDENDHERAKRPRKGSAFSRPSMKMLMQQLSSEITSVMQDASKSAWEKNQWMKTRLIQLEEQQVSYQYQSLELEKQKLKWVKYSSKKERDMERAKLENEGRRLENERMLLLVRQKKLELLEFHNHQQQQNSSNKRSDPSSLTG